MVFRSEIGFLTELSNTELSKCKYVDIYRDQYGSLQQRDAKVITISKLSSTTTLVGIYCPSLSITTKTSHYFIKQTFEIPTTSPYITISESRANIFTKTQKGYIYIVQ